ncbi:unnamed protein product [Eruca vesicaria subsp. sativa]|uniref:Uncharacterized protein n=1 Tax=Eruca vesicaria subsp. sativa TaxID=29727 RepID=A0ABC8LFK4_ERUVS|nr:unnamed protein product [Eruca vesicaria subsp. sativa]
MTGPRGSKPGREIFLTSSSLSFSSLSSSSCALSEEAIEINMKASQTSFDQKGKLMKASSRGSEMSCLTHVTMQPAPSPPSKFQPGSPYDPERIPASVFGKKGKDLNWSDDSLFSLRMSNFDAFRQSNLNPEDLLLMSREFLAYSPSLKIKYEDPEEEEISHVMKKKETSSSVESIDVNQEKSSSSSSPTPPAYSYPVSFAQLYQAQPKPQSITLPVVEKKSKKKRKKTRKNKKEKVKEKTNNNKCSSGFQIAKFTCVAATDGRNVAAAAHEFSSS